MDFSWHTRRPSAQSRLLKPCVCWIFFSRQRPSLPPVKSKLLERVKGCNIFRVERCNVWIRNVLRAVIGSACKARFRRIAAIAARRSAMSRRPSPLATAWGRARLRPTVRQGARADFADSSARQNLKGHLFGYLWAFGDCTCAEPVSPQSLRFRMLCWSVVLDSG